MPRYIDADELWLQLDKRESFEQGRNRAYYKGLRDAKKVLDEQPTADVVERKKGTWIKKMRVVETEKYITYDFDWYCACCGAKYDTYMAKIVNFCYVCGADMRGDGNDN